MQQIDYPRGVDEEKIVSVEGEYHHKENTSRNKQAKHARFIPPNILVRDFSLQEAFSDNTVEI